MTDKQEQALAVPERKAVDEYERKYMKGAGAVLHRTKRPAPKWLQLVLASGSLSGLAFVLTPMWYLAPLFVPFGIIMWALFSMLRVTVSEGAVNIQYGLFGPTIPMQAIASAEAVDYDWKKFGGWGIKRSFDGQWMYSMPGDNGRAIRIVWIDAKGKERTTNVGMPNPEATAAAIDQAMKALPPAPEQEALSAGKTR